MRCLFLSPLRVRPKDWPRWYRAVTAALYTGDLPGGFGGGWAFHKGVDYKYHPLLPDDDAVTDGEGGAGTHLVAAFSRVRRSSFASQVLYPGAVLFVFDTGEAMVVEEHILDGDRDTILRSLEEKRVAASQSVRNAGARLKDAMAITGGAFVDGETITHTILVDDPDDAVTTGVLRHCFAAEGLDLDAMRGGDRGAFVTGWSYSAFPPETSARFWDGVSVVARSQCEWYSVRIARRYCLGTLANSDLKRSVDDLVVREREIVRYQTDLRLWAQRMGEYRANLKPGLTDQSRAIEAMWDVDGALGHVLETLSQSRDLIETSYSRRILLQERRQSQMLFFLTVLGVLSLASIAASYWNWLTLARITDDTAVATGQGQVLVAAGLGALIVILGVLIAIYVRIRRRPD